MKQTFDTNEILFSVLDGYTALKSAISGAVYNGERPLNSSKEDVVVNTIALSQDHEPQIGTSNVNIHVPDKTVSIAGNQQKVVDNSKLKIICAHVLNALRGTKIQGLKMTVETQSNPIQEPEIQQHYVNIRISWNIH